MYSLLPGGTLKRLRAIRGTGNLIFFVLFQIIF